MYFSNTKTEAVDDMVVVEPGGVRAIQAKYLVDNLAVDVPDDFTAPESRTGIGRFAKGWLNARQEYPNVALTAELLSNRGRDSQLERIIGADGKFTQPFVDGRIRREPRRFRDALRAACAFPGSDADTQFHEFLTAFRFRLREPAIADLRRLSNRSTGSEVLRSRSQPSSTN